MNHHFYGFYKPSPVMVGLWQPGFLTLLLWLDGQPASGNLHGSGIFHGSMPISYLGSVVLDVIFFSYLVGDYLWLMIKYGYIMIYYCIWIRYMIRYYMILVNDYPAWKTLDIFGSFRYGKIHHAFFFMGKSTEGSPAQPNPVLSPNVSS